MANRTWERWKYFLLSLAFGALFVWASATEPYKGDRWMDVYMRLFSPVAAVFCVGATLFYGVSLLGDWTEEEVGATARDGWAADGRVLLCPDG